MHTRPDLLTPAFLALSAKLGKDPLQVQAAGGNTSVKEGGAMWIKASGTELANAQRKEIFVPVDHAAALTEATGKSGDGSCRDAVLDPDCTLRPSIETTFHAALEHRIVVHTHSVSTIAHVICPQGRMCAMDKLEGLQVEMVPYCKPGRPLTQAIMARATKDTRIILLENHGLICCGGDVGEVEALLADVEARLALDQSARPVAEPNTSPPSGFDWASETWLAVDDWARAMVTRGSYYPDHVVFLGPGLPVTDHAGSPPVVIHAGLGVAIRKTATAGQRALLRCLFDVISRLPRDWNAEPLGRDAENDLLNWDAEKYRLSMAGR